MLKELGEPCFHRWSPASTPACGPSGSDPSGASAIGGVAGAIARRPAKLQSADEAADWVVDGLLRHGFDPIRVDGDQRTLGRKAVVERERRGASMIAKSLGNEFLR